MANRREQLLALRSKSTEVSEKNIDSVFRAEE
jgi:hypothetical protein